VSRNNLRRDEAGDRARLLTVAAYRVELDLTGESTFRTRTRVGFDCREPGAATFIELTAPAVHSITLNGEPLDPAEGFDGDRIRLPRLAAGNELEVVADGAYSRTGEGLHRFVDPVDGGVYLYSQFETYDAHRVYACFDQPDLKAVFDLTVVAPDGWTCVSNGRQVSAEDAGPGRTRVRFAPTPVVSPYVTALVAGPYHAVRDRHDGIDLGVFCRGSLAEFLDPEEILTVTRQGFDFFHRVFDYRYPFDKYDQLFVPEFNAGAMENAGCVTFLEDYVFRSKVTDARRERRAETVLHELAHMWFGDLVTMRWWDDLWLNESFATYMSVLAQVSATRFRAGWTTFCNAEKTWAYRQDQLPTTHPIVADAVDIEAVRTNFDGITYAKGASVLKQLVSWVGQEEFLAGVRAYFRRHEFANTTLRDLLDVLEQASGRDLTAWSAEWLATSGVNTLRAAFEVDADGTFRSFEIRQEAPTEHSTLRSHRVAVGLYDRTGDGLRRRDRVEIDVVGAVTDVPKLVGVRQPDLVLLNDDDLTYAKIRLDERSLATVTEAIGEIRESLPRALCWAAAWDMTRDAELPARDYLRLVLTGVPVENDIGVVQSLLGKAKLALEQYAEPGSRDEGLRALADTAYDLLVGAGPGTDFQLAYAHAFIAAARSPRHVAVLRGLLDGSREVPGLAVDTELRWTLLTRLVVLGAAGEADIDAELARDDTATGEKRAVTARAARPEAEAKAAAWSAVVDSDGLSNHLQVAAMRGFVQPEHAELIRPYVERYFARVGGLWQTRSMETAQTITELLYPAVLVEPATVERTDAFLAAQDAPPPLRRLLLEGRAGVARALRARERDRAAAGVG
jgi:aminopeptidase N